MKTRNRVTARPLVVACVLSLLAGPGHAQEEPDTMCLHRIYITFDTIHYFTDDYPGFIPIPDSVLDEHVWAMSVFPQQHTITLDLCAGTITGLNFRFANAVVHAPNNAAIQYFETLEGHLIVSVIFYVEEEAFYFFRIAPFYIEDHSRVLFYQFTEDGVAGFVGDVHLVWEEALAQGP